MDWIGSGHRKLIYGQLCKKSLGICPLGCKHLTPAQKLAVRPNQLTCKEWGGGIPLPSRLEGLGIVVSSPSGARGGSPAENDFGAFWGHQNGSRCNTCRTFCIFAQILMLNRHQLGCRPSLSAPCLMLYVGHSFGLHNTPLPNSLSFPLSVSSPSPPSTSASFP